MQLRVVLKEILEEAHLLLTEVVLGTEPSIQGDSHEVEDDFTAIDGFVLILDCFENGSLQFAEIG